MERREHTPADAQGPTRRAGEQPDDVAPRQPAPVARSDADTERRSALAAFCRAARADGLRIELARPGQRESEALLRVEGRPVRLELRSMTVELTRRTGAQLSVVHELLAQASLPGEVVYEWLSDVELTRVEVGRLVAEAVAQLRQGPAEEGRELVVSGNGRPFLRLTWFPRRAARGPRVLYNHVLPDLRELTDEQLCGMLLRWAGDADEQCADPFDATHRLASVPSWLLLVDDGELVTRRLGMDGFALALMGAGGAGCSVIERAFVLGGYDAARERRLLIELPVRAR